MATVAEAATLIRSQLDASGYVRGAQQIEDANQEIAASTEQVTVTSERQQRTLQQTGGAFERLRRSLDEVYREQQRFEQAQRTLNTGLDRGSVSVAEHARLLELARARYQGLGGAAQNAGAGAQRLAQQATAASNAFGGIGQRIQGAGYQLQDFVVQVQGGQSWMTALSQQGSQFLGAFGMGGAVAGAILTVGLLAAKFAGLSEEVKKAADLGKEQELQLDRLTDVNQLLNRELETSEERQRRLTLARRADIAALVAQTTETQRLTMARLIEGRQMIAENLDVIERRRGTPLTAEQRERITSTRQGEIEAIEANITSLSAEIVTAEDRLRRLLALGDRTPDQVARTAARTVREAVRDAETGYTDAVTRRLQQIRERNEAEEKRARDAREREEERRLEEQERHYNRVVRSFGDGIADALTDGLFDGSRRGEDTLKRLATAFGKAVTSAISTALSNFVIQPMVNRAFGALGVTPASLGALGGGTGIDRPGGNLAGGGMLGGTSRFGGLSDLFGAGNSPLAPGYSFQGGFLSRADGFLGTGIAGFLDTPVYGNAGLAYGPYSASNPGLAFGADGAMANSLTYGQAALGAAGILGGGLGIYSGLQTGGPRGAAQVVGGTAGVVGGAAGIAAGSAGALGLGAGATAALGAVASVAPYVAAIAAIVAALLPGQKPSNAAAGGTIDLRTGQQRPDDSGKSTPETRGARDQLLALMEQQAAQLGAITGVRPVGSVHFEIGARDPSRLHLNGMDMGSAPVGDVDALADLFSRALIDAYRRTDDLDIQQRLIIDKSGDLQTAIDNLGWYQSVYKPFMDNAAMDPNDVQRSNAMKALQDQVAALQKPFEDAAAKARELGLATEQLVVAQAAAVEDFNHQRWLAQQGIEQGLDVRLLRATGQDSAAALLEQSVQAAQERQQFQQQLLQLLPEDSAAEWRAAMLAKLDGVQAAERQQIVNQQQQIQLQQEAQQEQQRQAAAQSAAGAISSLTAYARSLRTGETSPLGYRAQYDLASRDFFGVQDLAASGNVDAIGRLQESASAFLNISRIVNGSGTAFAADNERVLAAIESVANRGPEQLTQDFMALEFRTQTATLAEKLDEILEELAAQRREQRQAALAPAVAP